MPCWIRIVIAGRGEIAAGSESDYGFCSSGCDTESVGLSSLDVAAEGF